mmetsp:Transcript_23699/g.54902  ORF Transcript_23699/g.54902 Transcript_23699/m.54902 type:complete len:222 (+) Transcript_23699:343-1008(+)
MLPPLSCSRYKARGTPGGGGKEKGAGFASKSGNTKGFEPPRRHNPQVLSFRAERARARIRARTRATTEIDPVMRCCRPASWRAASRSWPAPSTCPAARRCPARALAYVPKRRPLASRRRRRSAVAPPLRRQAARSHTSRTRAAPRCSERCISDTPTPLSAPCAAPATWTPRACARRLRMQPRWGRERPSVACSWRRPRRSRPRRRAGAARRFVGAAAAAHG